MRSAARGLRKPVYRRVMLTSRSASARTREFSLIDRLSFARRHEA